VGTEEPQSTVRVPDAVAEAAAARRFGTATRAYEPDGLIAAITAAMVGLGLWVLFCLFFAWLTDEWSAWGGAVVFLAGSGVVLTAQEVSRGRRRHRPHFYEFERGLVRSRRDEVTVHSWDEVEYVERATYQPGAQCSGGYTYAYLLKSRTGLAEIALPCHLDGAATRIAQVTLAQARESLRHAEPVRFGAITAEPAGLVIDGVSLAWNDVDRVDLSREHVRVFRNGVPKPWKALPVGAVPDARALVSLTGEHAAAAADDVRYGG
jgi:hypothetical protein